MPKNVEIPPQSPQKNSKSGNEGIPSYGQFLSILPKLWVVGGGTHLGKVPLILACDQQNLLGPSRSVKNDPH